MTRDKHGDGSGAGSDPARDELVRLTFGARDPRSESILREGLFDRALPAEEEAHLAALLGSLRGDGLNPDDELRERIRSAVAREATGRTPAESRERSGPARGRRSGVAGRSPASLEAGPLGWLRRPVPAWAVALGVAGGVLFARALEERIPGENRRVAAGASPAAPGMATAVRASAPEFVVAESYATDVALPASSRNVREESGRRPLASDSL